MTREIAKAFAENEFEKYRKIRDQKYVSDFDKLMLEVEKKGEKLQMVADGRLKKKDIKNDTIIYRGDDNVNYTLCNNGELIEMYSVLLRSIIRFYKDFRNLQGLSVLEKNIE